MPKNTLIDVVCKKESTEVTIETPCVDGEYIGAFVGGFLGTFPPASSSVNIVLRRLPEFDEFEEFEED